MLWEVVSFRATCVDGPAFDHDFVSVVVYMPWPPPLPDMTGMPNEFGETLSPRSTCPVAAGVGTFTENYDNADTGAGVRQVFGGDAMVNCWLHISVLIVTLTLKFEFGEFAVLTQWLSIRHVRTLI
jgi:hypothetical protein